MLRTCGSRSAWSRLRRAIDGIPNRLADFTAETYGLDAIEEAWAEFMVWEGGAFDPESPIAPLFMSWLYHSWQPDPWEDEYAIDASLRGRTPTSVFLEQRAQRLDPLAQRYLTACLAAPFSFHEILSCDAGSALRDHRRRARGARATGQRVDGPRRAPRRARELRRAGARVPPPHRLGLTRH